MRDKLMGNIEYMDETFESARKEIIARQKFTAFLARIEQDGISAQKYLDQLPEGEN